MLVLIQAHPTGSAVHRGQYVAIITLRMVGRCGRREVRRTLVWFTPPLLSLPRGLSRGSVCVAQCCSTNTPGVRSEATKTICPAITLQVPAMVRTSAQLKSTMTTDKRTDRTSLDCVASEVSLTSVESFTILLVVSSDPHLLKVPLASPTKLSPTTKMDRGYTTQSSFPSAQCLLSMDDGHQNMSQASGGSSAVSREDELDHEAFPTRILCDPRKATSKDRRQKSYHNQFPWSDRMLSQVGNI